MSKTVKRVMTVMMIGLVALLGAKAEAHTRWAGNRPYTCMTCDEAELEEVPADPADFKKPAPALVAELIVQAKTATLMCADDTKVELKAADGEMTLIAEMPSNLWTYFPGAGGEGEAVVSFEVFHELFEILGFCEGKVKDARIPKMNATYNTYEKYKIDARRRPECIDSGCSQRVLLDTRKLIDCTVRPNAADGTFYRCGEVRRGHHPTPTPTK